jgi:ribose 5-phosphate isomerase B
MRIAIGSDHAGYELKKYILDRLGSKYEFLDVGTDSSESVDYPDYASLVAEAILNGDADLGILICGTGIGMSIAANKYRGVYAAVVYSDETAALAKKHNNANIICLGARMISYGDALRWVETWLNTEFEGGRHLRRINKIKSLEERVCGQKSR